MATAVFCCGRMNPPTLGHIKVVKKMREIAKQIDAEAFLFTTISHDERNPLPANVKKDFLERVFGQEVVLVKSPYQAIEILAERFDEAVFFIGEDRVDKFLSLVNAAMKIGLKIRLHVLTRAVDDVSASEARKYAKEGNFTKFCSLVPQPDRSFQEELYNAVRHGMGVDDGFIWESFG